MEADYIGMLLMASVGYVGECDKLGKKYLSEYSTRKDYLSTDPFGKEESAIV